MSKRRNWPEHVVFFQQLKPVLLENGTYGESWRSFNSHWYDDWRRHGDICWHCMRLRNLNAFNSIYTCSVPSIANTSCKLGYPH